MALYLEELDKMLKDTKDDNFKGKKALQKEKEDRWSWHPRQIELMEGAKEKARELGLWNFFLPDPDGNIGDGLTNLDYTYVATEIGNTNLGLSALKSLLKINSDEFNVLEDVISGTGISRMFETKTGNKVKSEEIFSLSLNGDDDAKEVIDMFTIAFARTLSDLSLAFSSGGGIILAGSLSRSFLTIANKDLFNKHFLDGKSDIHKEILNKVGIKVANRGYTCLFGSLNYINSI